MLTNIYRIVKLGFNNFYRNGLLSMAATLILTITLFTISIFATLVLVGNSTIENVSSRIDVVAYLKDEVKEAQVVEIRKDLSLLDGVREVDYITKDMAYEKWQGQEQDQRLKDVVTREDNPLPRSLEIKMADPEKTEAVAQYLENDEIKSSLHRVRYNKELIEKLNKYISIIKRVGIGLVSIFVVISVLVVFNTIRLAIFARKDEIDIMKLVGATPSFIRSPFLVEGTLFGILAAVFASLIILIGIKYLQISGILNAQTTQEIVRFLGPEATDYFSRHKFLIFVYQVVAGITISVTCSYAAIYKHLNFKKK